MPDAITYEEIADQGGLNPGTKQRFVFYMKHRWSDTEGQKCKDGYAMEWCQRFFQGREYSASDHIGQRLLEHMGEG